MCKKETLNGRGREKEKSEIEKREKKTNERKKEKDCMFQFVLVTMIACLVFCNSSDLCSFVIMVIIMISRQAVQSKDNHSTVI
jgi:hypothetical protein